MVVVSKFASDEKPAFWACMLAESWCRGWWDTFSNCFQILKKNFSFFVVRVCGESNKARNRGIIFCVICRDKASMVNATEALSNS